MIKVTSIPSRTTDTYTKGRDIPNGFFLTSTRGYDSLWYKTDVCIVPITHLDDNEFMQGGISTHPSSWLNVRPVDVEIIIQKVKGL